MLAVISEVCCCLGMPRLRVRLGSARAGYIALGVTCVTQDKACKCRPDRFFEKPPFWAAWAGMQHLLATDGQLYRGGSRRASDFRYLAPATDETKACSAAMTFKGRSIEFIY